MTSTFDDLRFAVIDVEGNGQQPPEIVEIAVVPVDGLAVGAPASWLVMPSRPITPIVTRKAHGIRNADVASAPAFDQIAPQVLATLAGRIPVAHNARVEYEALRRHLHGWTPEVMLDTLRLAKAIWPGLASYSLDPLLAHAGITPEGAGGTRHRAGFDAHATALLFAGLARTTAGRDELYALARLPGMIVAEPGQEGLW